MGSWKEDRYQQSLQKIVDLMNSEGTVPANVSFQPDNPEDINAIKVDAYVNEPWHIVGNIKQQEIPNLTRALRHNKIRTVKFTEEPVYKITIQRSGHSGYMCPVDNAGE